ncbi:MULTISPECIES: LPXTG cell wall anchor domain-containing protein [Streptococcus]|uniref:LPXTG cell wall anchor domain-containing protein n=1 Tax=Streptococcus sp. UMB0029 TaxID=2069308 RepID=UPI002155E75E|nr:MULTISPECIES: LPXTG cell wall anchor domain-containing protein [Streptococcus]MDK7322936.1 LPXTG cell wall anchor domain-containing protein [Streptococcus mitis]
MNKLTKLGIVTFSAVTLSAVVPTLVHAEENVAPQPNAAVKPNTAQPTPAPKPAENPQSEVKPTEQPQPTQPVKPVENKPVENKPAETPVPAPKPAENPQPEVKPTEQPQENNRKPVRRWPLRDGSVHEHPVVTYADIVAPLPISDMKETPINGIWTAEKDFINNKPRLTFFWGSGNRYLEENGREFSREEMLKSDIFMRPIRVKIPELEGRNYEAYTIYTGILDGKTRKVELNKNTNITGQGYMVFRTKKEDNDVEVYQFSKNRQLTPLYHRYQLNERGRSVGEFGLYAEVYQTYVFLFKNHTEKQAEKPSEQPKPDKQPSVPTIPADQPQPTKPEKPAEKPSENPVNPVTPVAPVTPTTPVTPTLNPDIPNNTRVLSSEAGSVQVYGSEATLKNVRYIRVEETKSTSLESKKYKAFDIHLYDARGKAIQPNGMVLVSLSADKPVENVYYVAPDGTLQALKFKQDTDKVTFETNHFSIYAMTFKVAASRDNGGSPTPVPVVNSSNTPTTTEQKENDASSTKTQADPLATKTETISKQVAKTLPNTGENNSILATLFGMLTLTAGLFSFRKESE